MACGDCGRGRAKPAPARLALGDGAHARECADRTEPRAVACRRNRRSESGDIVELDDMQMLVQSLAENLQRQNLTDLEKAEGVGRLFEGLDGDFSDERSPITKKVAPST